MSYNYSRMFNIADIYMAFRNYKKLNFCNVTLKNGKTYVNAVFKLRSKSFCFHNMDFGH